jgi:phosphoribosylformylglycinamidine cyclo-ligase
MSQEYKKAGVDIDAGERFVRNIKPFIKSTHRRGVISDIGGFGGYFALDTADMREPVLVSGTDGVGTKLRIAIELGRLETIGQDLVAMCVNDIACSGAEPLFFLDYFATAKLDPDSHASIVKGIADACAQTKCALIGGETAEMPDMYAAGDFDLAGFAVGIVDRERIIDGSMIGAGNAIIGLASSGFHSNGYSLIRRVIKNEKLDLTKVYDGFDKTLGEALLEPTRLYSPVVAQLRKEFDIKGIAHITGGGFWDNIPRILPESVQAVISKDSWSVPEMFRFFQLSGSIDEDELFRVFNCGVGMVLVVDADRADELIQQADSLGQAAWLIGKTQIKPAGEAAVVME